MRIEDDVDDDDDDDHTEEIMKKYTLFIHLSILRPPTHIISCSADLFIRNRSRRPPFGTFPIRSPWHEPLFKFVIVTN